MKLDEEFQEKFDKAINIFSPANNKKIEPDKKLDDEINIHSSDA